MTVIHHPSCLCSVTRGEMARTMPRLRLLCCSLATTEVGEYEGGIYDRQFCDRECGGCFTAHLCDVVALLRGERAKEATAKALGSSIRFAKRGPRAGTEPALYVIV